MSKGIVNRMTKRRVDFSVELLIDVSLNRNSDLRIACFINVKRILTKGFDYNCLDYNIVYVTKRFNYIELLNY